MKNRFFSVIFFLNILICLQSEQLSFSIDYLGISVANVNFDKKYSDNHIEILVTAMSSGFTKLFTHSFDNSYKIIANDKYLPKSYKKTINQRNFKENSITNYSYDSLIATYKDISSGKDLKYSIKSDSKDFFTALYYLRTIDLSKNQNFTIDAAGKIWIIETMFLNSEVIKTALGKLSTQKVEIKFTEYDKVQALKSDILTNNLVNNENILYFWFTEDDNRIPVKAQYSMNPFNVNWIIKGYSR